MTNLQLDLMEHINAEKLLMNALTELLNIELKALANNKLLVLDENTSNKNNLLVQISESEKQRHVLLKNLGYLPDFTAISSQAEVSPLSVELENNWATLLDLSQKAKKSNQTNGVLINRLITKNQDALNILTNESNTSTGLYGPSGQSMGGNSGSRNIFVG